jgi:hypothetical protein
MLAVLNGLDVMACNLENAYLNAPCVEKIWFEGGLESNVGLFIESIINELVQGYFHPDL